MSLHNFPSRLYEDEIRVSRDGGVVTITINNASKMNTMARGVNTGIVQALEMCADDKTVMVVVLTGAGERAFCAGGNLDGGMASAGFRGEEGANKPPPTVQSAIRNLRTSMMSSQLLRESHFVSIAAVNGACAGAGLSWACACDLRIASENALFRSGFIGAGLSGDFGGTWTLPRIVGAAKAREIYFLNEKIRANEALRIGLASKVIPARGDTFKAKVHEIALQLAASAPLALKRIKSNLLDSDKTQFSDHLDLEAERHAKCGFHPDAAEAGLAFLQKREGLFQGIGHNRKNWESSKL
mmetsp:Transcript_138562/g.196150  ORF Transcript_138562/g.196150 Transcript_138562/m.196150 type:complete len:298 (-) Transcript_138562:94-987(-)